MAEIQTIVTLLVVCALAFLIIDGLASGAVWVKGTRTGLFTFRHWAHKRSRDEDPWPYWFALSFYGVALICLCWLLAFG